VASSSVSTPPLTGSVTAVTPAAAKPALSAAATPAGASVAASAVASEH